MARSTLRRTGDDQRPPAGHPPSRPACRPPPTPCVVTALVHDRRSLAAGIEADKPTDRSWRLTRRPSLRRLTSPGNRRDAGYFRSARARTPAVPAIDAPLPECPHGRTRVPLRPRRGL